MPHITLDGGLVGIALGEELEVLLEIPAVRLERVGGEAPFHVQRQQVLLDALR
jgi:hypothetical protein